MLNKISIYVCTISLFLGTSTMDAKRVPMYGVSDVTPEDTLSQPEASVESTAVDQSAPIAASLDFDPYDYRLQGRHREYGEPYRNDSARWLQHLSLGMFAGLNFHGNQPTVNQSGIKPVDRGRTFGVSLRYQWSPLHGVRAVYMSNEYTNNPFNVDPIKIDEVMLGYTFNFTNYFKGYNPKKRFHVSASASIAGARVNYQDQQEYAARAELGLIFDYRFWRNWSLYAEPYMGITTDNYDLHDQHHAFDYIGGIRGGLLLNMNALRDAYIHIRNAQNDLYQPKAWFQNFYIGSSYGRMFSNAATVQGLDKKWVDSHVYVGYRFGPIQSLRLMADYNKSPEPLERKHHVMGEIDYMLDFRTMWGGYDPHRRFRVSGYVGAGARYLDTNNGKGATHLKQYDDKVAPYATLGVDLSYYITRQVSFFAEPWAAMAFPIADGQKSTLFGGLRGGFQIDFIDNYIYLPRYAKTNDEKSVAMQWRRRPMSHFFFGASTGLMGVHKEVEINHTEMPFNVFLGYRLTPIQAFRVQASYTKAETEKLLQPRSKHIMAHLDYMVNFSNLFYGYKPKRWLNVIGYVGAGLKYLEPNWEYYDDTPDKVKLAPMVTSGANLSFRVYNGISLFAEPWAGLHRGKGQHFYTFTYGVNGGVAVNLDDAYLYGLRVMGTPSPLWKTNFLRHFFVGAGGGVMGIHTDELKAGNVKGWDTYNHLTLPTNIFMGYHFSPNQSVRARAFYVKTFETKERARHLQGTIDYMLNLTNALAGYNPKRWMNTFVYAGIGANYLVEGTGQNKNGKLSPMATMGADLTIRIKNGLSAYIEPFLAVSKRHDDGFYTMYYGANTGLALDFDPIYAYRPGFGHPSEKWNQKTKERLFFGGSFGWLRLQRQYDKDLYPAAFFAGYRFSPIHALRGKINYNKTVHDKTMQRYHLSGNVDYMFNLTNILNEYNPNRRINWIGFIGLGTRFPETNQWKSDGRYTQKGHLRLQGNAGLDVALAITRNVNFFVEPYVGAVRAGNHQDFLDFYMGVNSGFVVTLLDFYKPWGKEKIDFNHGPFFEGSLGYMFPTGSGSINHMAGLSLDGRAGVWFDPIFGARASFVAENYYYSKHYASQAAYDAGESDGYAGAMALKMRIEGLLNPFNITPSGRKKAGTRKFDLNLAAGIEFGGIGKKYADGMGREGIYGKGQENYGIYGVTAAVQLLYNATNACALYIEPRYEFMKAWYYNDTPEFFGGHSDDHIVTINAGVRVTRATLAQKRRNKPLGFQEDWFLALSAGGYRAINGYKPDHGGRTAGSFTINVGYNITPVHAAKVQFEPSFYRTKYEGYKYRLMDYRLIYMTNVTNVYQGRADRHINVFTEIGPVVSTIVKKPAGVELASKRALGLAGGFEVCYNFTKHMAIFCEPLGQFVFKKEFLPGFGFRPHMKQMRVDLSVGYQYNF